MFVYVYICIWYLCMTFVMICTWYLSIIFVYMLFAIKTKYHPPFLWENWVKMIRFVCHLLYVNGWTASGWLAPLLLQYIYWMKDIFFFCKFGQICWDCICLSMRGNLGRGWFWVEEEEDAKFCWSIYHSNSNNTQLFLLSAIWKRRKAFMHFGISWFKSNQLCVKTCLAFPNHKISERQKLYSGF